MKVLVLTTREIKQVLFELRSALDILTEMEDYNEEYDLVSGLIKKLERRLVD